MRRILGLTIVAGGVALAVLIGQRLSTDAMAVAVGVVFGVAASIPTSLLVVAATRRGREERVERRADYHVAPQPQIYVVAPGAAGQAPWPGTQGWGQVQPPASAGWAMPPANYQLSPPQRRYRVVGEDDGWLD